MEKMKSKNQGSTTSIKCLPNNKDAEQAVIGTIINFNNKFDEVSFLHSSMFYDNRYGHLFDIISKMNKEQKGIDVVTVCQEVISSGKMDEIPPYFITETCDPFLSPAHLVDHALIVKQKYAQRQLIKLSHQIMSESYDDLQDVGDVLFGAIRQLESLQDNLIGYDDVKSFGDITTLALKEIDRRINLYATGTQTGIPTGLVDLNRITSGWQGSELIVIAARPAMGKTAISLHFAKAAASNGTPVAFFSLEMSSISLYNRVLSCESGVLPERLKSGNLNKDDISQIDKAAKSLYALPMYVDDNASVSMSYIRSKCRMLHKKGKCGMVIIDYLQLASETGSDRRSREQEITQMSREAKIIAKELNVPVLLLSQLNRSVEKREDKKPMLSDLRESGSIEQDADMVMFIHRPEYYGIEVCDNGKPVKNYGELIIAKYRDGKVGKVKFTHNDSLTKIFDYDTNGYAATDNMPF